MLSAWDAFKRIFMAKISPLVIVGLGVAAYLLWRQSDQDNPAEYSRPMFGFTILDYAAAAPWNDPNFIGL